jgi:uncharacterized membrane protein YphA (DoxX/SURF4 family)
MAPPTQRIIAALIGVIFLIAGSLKALDPAAFAIDIQNYRLLPWTCGVLLALYLPWVEILCGSALILHVAYRGALCLTACLCALFIAAYGSTRPRGLDIACGCFGHGVHRGYWPVLIGDTLLLATIIYLLRADSHPLAPIIRGASPGENPGEI